MKQNMSGFKWGDKMTEIKLVIETSLKEILEEIQKIGAEAPSGKEWSPMDNKIRCYLDRMDKIRLKK